LSTVCDEQAASTTTMMTRARFRITTEHYSNAPRRTTASPSPSPKRDEIHD
jgi:hypothetical protein